MNKYIIFFITLSSVGCAPAYVVPQEAPTATVNISHAGDLQSTTSFDIFSSSKCENKFYVGELADLGSHFTLKKASIVKIEANKVVYLSGTRKWRIAGSNLESWCSIMFSFTPTENIVYSMKINGSGYSTCSLELFEETSKKPPKDLQIYKSNRICQGDSVHYEK